MEKQTQIDNAFFGVSVACCSIVNACMCGPAERVLRGYAYGEMPAMSQAQRIACLDEIEAYEEGANRADWEGSTDAQLAAGVLSAWSEYCRDLGMF